MRARTVLACTVCGVALLAGAGSAAAQSAGGGSELDEVVVTGSRIQRSGFTTPTPVTVVTSEQLTKQSPGTVAEAIAQLPSMRFSGTSTTRSGTSGGSGGTYLDLRGLSSVRTLVLLDGRRVVGGTAAGTPDANLIPSALLERVDVVTGGASAAYGSDAVAGVVNFILNKRFEGVQLEAQTGISHYGDNKEGKLGVAWGGSLLGGRAHVLASAEAYHTDGILCRCERPTERDSWGIILNPAYTPTNGLPRRLLVADVQVANAGYGGLITSSPFRNLTFGSNGETRPFQFGSLVSGASMIGGEGPRPSDYTVVSSPLSRGASFIRGSYDLSDDATLYLEGMFGANRVLFSNGPSDSIGASSLPIRRDNPYLPNSLRDAMAAQNVSSVTVARSYGDLPDKLTYQRNWTQRYVAGTDFKLGDWKVGAYYEYGLNRNSSRVINNLNLVRLAQAVDAVRSATGQIVCRSTLTNPTDGCVPFNPLGAGRSSREAQNYVLGTSVALARYQQDVASLFISGEPFASWAGPIALAAGVEYRRDKFKQRTDLTSVSLNPFTRVVGGWRNANPQPQYGLVRVKEAFAELDVPLAKAAAWADELNLNLAGRVADYSTSGRVESWKVGLQYKPLADLRFRATRSRDIRAPNINDLFLGGTQTFANIIDPVRNVQVSNVRIVTRGNPDLVPELADTTALGLVYQPSWISGLNVSVDLYKIDIHDAVATLAAQTLVDQCQAGAPSACATVIRDPSGTIAGIDLVPLNLASLKTNGVDFEALYRIGLDRLNDDWDGALTFALRGTYVAELETTTPGAAPIDRAGDVGGFGNGLPHWRWSAQATVDRGPWSLFLQGRYVGGGRMDSGVPLNDIDINEVDNRFYVDGRVAYRHGEAEYFVSVANLMNRAAPPAPGAGFSSTNLQFYDAQGQMWRIGVRLRR